MESFNIGRTLSRTFGLITSTLPSVGLFLLLVQVANTAIQYGSQQLLVDSGASAQGGTGAAALAVLASGWYWVMTLLSLALSSIAVAGSIHGFLQSDEGRPVSLADCARVGVAKLLPVLGLTILWYLGVGIGWILLLVPGLILMTMWSASLPALIGEDLDVIASFGRSRELTKGSRWRILVTLLVFMFVIYAVLFGVLGAVIGGGMMGMLAGMRETDPWVLLLTIAFGWLSAAVTNALLVSIYLETVTIKEGGTSGQLDDIFG